MGKMKNQDGQALVEFAVVLPVLLLLIMGIAQFGMAFSSYLTLENASRDATRAGIIGYSDEEIHDVISTFSPGLESDKLTITITPSDGSRTSGDTLTVKLTYNYELTVPIISSIFSNMIVLNTETSMRIE